MAIPWAMRDTPLTSSVHNEPNARVGGVEFRLATRADDAAIRAFLRGQSMDGPMRLAVATEPSFWNAVLGERAEVLIARDLAAQGVQGSIAGLGVRTLRTVLVQGGPVRAAHLSLLRIAPAFRRRRDFLRLGYTLLGQLQARDPADITFTAILSHNHAARRLLEAGLRGLPTYTPVTHVRTFTFGTRRLRRIDAPPAGAAGPAIDDPPAVLAFLRDHFATVDGAPCLDGSALHGRPSPMSAGHVRWEDFRVVRRNGQISAAAALWDQRPFRQVLVTGYALPLGLARPFLNACRALTGHAPLPAPGKPLALGYVSHLACPCSPEGLAAFPLLLKELATRAADRGMDYLVLSLAAGHPLAAAAARHASHQIGSLLYSVRWPEDPVVSLSGTPYVEAGIL